MTSFQVKKWRFLSTVLLLLNLSQAFIETSFQNSGSRLLVEKTAIHVALQETASLESLCDDLQKSFVGCQNDIAKTCKVAVGPTGSCGRLGLVAMKSISKGDVMLAMPYDDRFVLSAELARDTVFKGILPDGYDGWTGDTGLIALLILNEVARAAASGQGGVKMPKRTEPIQTFMETWVKTLPTPWEQQHPLLWSEDHQEILQSSSNTKIYRTLDDIEDDASWLTENVFEKDRDKFPETVILGADGQSIPCFSLDGYKWAMSLAQSRSVFVDSSLRLIPLMDMCNHDDDGEEVTGSAMGPFGTTKGAKLVATQSYKVGDEVFCSYGPKSAVDYLLDHGFVPPECWKTAVSELTFELDPEDRNYDDKLDILEFETYDQAPMDPVQSFDVVSAPGRDSEPDPAMIQFVRLCKLGTTDAFLLESIFRREVWGFMSMPVSEMNELQVVKTISEACEKALEDLQENSDNEDNGVEVCTMLRELETRALTRTLEYLQREREALDLKEYYQERRLKDLGLDSEWSPEDDMVDPDLGFGASRAPGGADYDW